MPPSSLVKFSHRGSSNGKKLFWDRVNVDNLPFRGSYPPMYRDEEFEEKTVRVADARNAFFDVRNPESNKQYLDVLECCANGWFRLLHLERFWRETCYHYVEWFEYYLEDGTRTPFVTAGIMEMSSGQQNLLNPGPG